jgi:hypothetical protein
MKEDLKIAKRIVGFFIRDNRRCLLRLEKHIEEKNEEK